MEEVILNIEKKKIKIIPDGLPSGILAKPYICGKRKYPWENLTACLSAPTLTERF